MKAMDSDQKPKRRRARGSGSVYLMGRIYWIAYFGVDGKRHAESSESQLKGVAERLLRSRVGDIDRGVPVTPQTGKLTFADAAKALKQTYTNEARRSLDEADRRITKHLTPFFGGKRMAGITTQNVRAFIARRQEQGITNKKGERVADVSPAEINRELTLLKRMFSIAIKDGALMHRPHIPMLSSGRGAATRFAELTNRSPWSVGMLAELHARAGDRNQARALVKELLEMARRQYVPPDAADAAYIALEEHDAALDSLEKGYEERSNQIAYIAVLPVYAPIRSHPRFQSLLERTGLR